MGRINHRLLLFAGVFSLLVLANLFLLAELGPLIAKVLTFFKTVLFPFFIAMIISYVLNPVVTLLSSRMVPRSVAVILIYATFLVSTLVLSMNLIPLLSVQFRELTEHFPEWNQRVQLWMHNMVDSKNALPLSVQDGIDGSLDKLEDALSGSIEGLLVGLRGTIGQLFIWLLIPFVVFYMLKDFKAMERSAVLLLPKKNRRKWLRLLREIDDALGNYIRGQLLVCVVVGVLAYIGYVMVGLPYAILLAFFVGITNIIPYLGPFIGAAPAVLVGVSESWKLAILVLLVNVMIHILESNVVSPQIVGRTLHLHPLVIIMALIVGGKLGGVLGLILAVPAFAVCKVVLEHLLVYRFH